MVVFLYNGLFSKWMLQVTLKFFNLSNYEEAEFNIVLSSTETIRSCMNIEIEEHAERPHYYGVED